MDQGYVCFDGSARGLGKFCRHPNVGDTCTTVDDCSGLPWNCRNAGAGFPGGYCTIEGCVVGDISACPSGSTCFNPGAGPFCVDNCIPGNPNTCRTGYDCVQLDADDFGCVPE
jgi:hypothetical protein